MKKQWGSFNHLTPKMQENGLQEKGLPHGRVSRPLPSPGPIRTPCTAGLSSPSWSWAFLPPGALCFRA